MQKSKRNESISKSVDLNKEYSLQEAIDTIKKNSKVKFVETLDCAIRLGVDPRHADQMIRGTVSLPNGTGKQVRVLVVCKGAKAQEALDAGADYAGFEEYLEKIKSGWAVVIRTDAVQHARCENQHDQERAHALICLKLKHPHGGRDITTRGTHRIER